MDREKKDELPKMQLSFIDEICLPLYKVMSNFKTTQGVMTKKSNIKTNSTFNFLFQVLSETFPWLQPLYDGASRNRQNWQDLAEKVDMGLTWIDYDVIEKPVEEFTSMCNYTNQQYIKPNF